jgi:hypothetical protein
MPFVCVLSTAAVGRNLAQKEENIMAKKEVASTPTPATTTVNQPLPYYSRFRRLVNAYEKLNAFIWMLNLPLTMLVNGRNQRKADAAYAAIVKNADVFDRLCGINNPNRLVIVSTNDVPRSVYAIGNGTEQHIVTFPVPEDYQHHQPADCAEHICDMFIELAQKFLTAKMQLEGK